MELISALHTAARRYCINQYTYWMGQYDKLFNDYSDRNPNTEEAKDIYPRCQLAQALLIDVERFLPEDFESIEQEKELFIEIGRTSRIVPDDRIKDDIKTRAIKEERAKFCRYVNDITTDELLSIQLMFYRKVISKKESTAFWRKLNLVWGIDQYWYPIIGCAPDDIIVFQDKYFRTEFGFEKLRSILQTTGCERIFELRECGAEPEYEMDICEFEPTYNGVEGYWFSEKMDWIIYASHESSTTVGGIWMIERIKALWPNWEKRLYDSPFFD